MKKIKLITTLCLALLGSQAFAQQVLSQVDAEANVANKERVLKSTKISPRQKAELLKAEKAEQAQPNLQASTSFLAANKIKSGVVTLASGVQYKVLMPGTGKRPMQADSVSARYQGTLVDGTGFDRADEKTPTVLHVAGLLPGLQEAVKRMPVGSKWEVVVPPALGYGAKGYHGVGPQAVLIYVIELTGII